jgi:pimeloyl-ACP methyl ester carboxylesterase
MPYLARETAKIFYDDLGEGPLVVTTHGVCENGSYWGRTGVSQRLADAGYRVADMDMRGHGRSVPTGEPKGYDVETIASDIGALTSSPTPREAWRACAMPCTTATVS